MRLDQNRVGNGHARPGVGEHHAVVRSRARSNTLRSRRWFCPSEESKRFFGLQIMDKTCFVGFDQYSRLQILPGFLQNAGGVLVPLDQRDDDTTATWPKFNAVSQVHFLTGGIFHSMPFPQLAMNGSVGIAFSGNQLWSAAFTGFKRYWPLMEI